MDQHHTLPSLFTQHPLEDPPETWIAEVSPGICDIPALAPPQHQTVPPVLIMQRPVPLLLSKYPPQLESTDGSTHAPLQGLRPDGQTPQPVAPQSGLSVGHFVVQA